MMNSNGKYSKYYAVMANVEEFGKGVASAYQIFLMFFGTIGGIMTLSRLIYALRGRDYDPMSEFWKWLVKEWGKKGLTKEEKDALFYDDDYYYYKEM